MKLDALKKNFLALKPFLKPFLILFLIYIVAMLAVFRAGVSFTDDQRRAIAGGAWLRDFNRHSSTALALLMNVNDRLLDISPWPQILGLAFLSIAGVILTYVFCDKKIKYLPLVLTAFIGLLPLTTECWLYKFDAPFMALSLLVSVLPILWWPKKMEKKALRKFGIVALICMLIIWTTYQASSGVFPVLCVFLALKDYFNGEKVSLILKKLLFAVGVFVVATLIFRFGLPAPTESYRETKMFGIMGLIPGVLGNFGEYLKMMAESLNIYQMILVGLAMVGTTILVFLKYKLKGFLILVAFLVALPLSIGAYLLLEEPSLMARALIGIGASFVPVLILATKDLKKFGEYVLVAPSLVLLYSFAVFVLALGNGLADQERWANYRVEDLASGLSELYPSESDVADRAVIIYGNIGYSAVLKHVANKFPATRKIMTAQQMGLSGAVWGLKKITDYYNRDMGFSGDVNRGYCGPEVSGVRADTYYYKIRENSEFICVDLK